MITSLARSFARLGAVRGGRAGATCCVCFSSSCGDHGPFSTRDLHELNNEVEGLFGPLGDPDYDGGEKPEAGAMKPSGYMPGSAGADWDSPAAARLNGAGFVRDLPGPRELPATPVRAAAQPFAPLPHASEPHVPLTSGTMDSHAAVQRIIDDHQRALAATVQEILDNHHQQLTAAIRTELRLQDIRRQQPTL